MPGTLGSKPETIQLTADSASRMEGWCGGPRLELLRNLTGVAETAVRGSMLAVERSWGIRGWQFSSFHTVVEGVAVR